MFQSYLILIVLLIYTLVVKNVCAVKNSCSAMPHIGKLASSYYCDTKAIAYLTKQLTATKNLNAYLENHLQKLGKKVAEHCPGYLNVVKEQVMNCPTAIYRKSCLDAMTDGSGVYRLQSLHGRQKYLLAYCLEDPNGGRPWTVIQRRTDETVCFDRKMHEYVMGFGDLFHNYWIGLENLHQMTYREPHELWIEMRDFDNNSLSARYSHFAVSSAETQYALRVVGSVSGGAGDSLTAHEGQKFSTPDHKNGRKCAKTLQSGWWFANCGQSNLNGKYYEYSHAAHKNGGIHWYTWRGEHYSYRYAHMAIREIAPNMCQ